MTIPDTYYDQLREKLKNAKITVKEDLDVVRNASLCPSEGELCVIFSPASKAVYSCGF